MYLTLHNGERDIGGGAFWKPASRYIISKAERRVKVADYVVSFGIGLLAGLILGAVLASLVDRLY